MKRLFFALWVLFALGAGATASAQKGVTLRVERDTYEELRLEMDFEKPTVDETLVCGQRFSRLTLEGCLPWGPTGSPELPVLSRMIEVPLCADFEVSVKDVIFDTFQLAGPVLVPVQSPRRKSDTTAPTLAFSSDLYGTDDFFGAFSAKVEEVGIARNRRLARLEVFPVSYNPVSGQVAVLRHAELTVCYRGVDSEGTDSLFARHYSEAFTCGNTILNSLPFKAVRSSAPVRYLIVAHSMFRGEMDDFIAWKRRKGFLTDIVYTDDPAVGSTTTSIQAYIRSQYIGATAQRPAPTYVLLVGDVEQLPPFASRVSSPDNDHVTDLYYMTWTLGDHLPDCHYGRFSAQNVAQLRNQIEKTLMYEQYTFADPSFLDRAVLVAGVDQGNAGDFGYTHADPAMDYAAVNYVNGAHGFSQVHYYKNDTTIIPSGLTNVTVHSSKSSMAARVRSSYNQGAGLINYSAHGSYSSWGTPYFSVSHVASMTNVQKFGLMIGNCCLTNKFEVPTCFGEALLRRGGYCGAVGYIGGSNSTYWTQDFYWAVGVRSGIGPSMSMAYNASHLGVYDRIFHTHNENYSVHTPTQGSMLMMGNMAVESSTAGFKQYYWEIYHLMGDPSLMPYMTQAWVMTVSAPATVPYGTASLSVTAVPHAYVALTDTLTGDLVAAAYANASGVATLALPTNLSVGGYEVAASAQQYRTAFKSLRVLPPAGAFPCVSGVVSAPLLAGDTVALTLEVQNLGTALARGVTIRLSMDNPLVRLTADSLYLDSLPAGATAMLSGMVSAVVRPSVEDLSHTDLRSTCTWTGSTLEAFRALRLPLLAPRPTFLFSNLQPNLLPGQSGTLRVKISNDGHGPLRTEAMAFRAASSLLAVTYNAGTTVQLAPGADTTIAVGLRADNALVEGIEVPLACGMQSNIGLIGDSLPVFIGPAYGEGFEGGAYHLGQWQQGTLPWVIIDSLAYEGEYCLRSAAGMHNNQTSAVTLTANVALADSVSFYYRVSSESGYDKFFFILDGDTLLNDSGEKGWKRAAFAVAAGSHSVLFSYVKDYSQSAGEDCVYVDGLLLPRSLRSVSFVRNNLCVGDALSHNGQAVSTSEAGVVAWCDTRSDGAVVLTENVIHPVYHMTSQATVCDSLSWNGNTYTATATLADSLRTVDGCDSIVALDLTVNYSVSITLEVVADTTFYVWNGTTYDTSGTYSQTFTTIGGCDSTVTLQLTLPGSVTPPAPPVTGIGEEAEGAIVLHPNPTAGKVAFGTEVDEVVVFDMMGQERLRRLHTMGLDLGMLPQGTYLLRISVGGGTIVRSVVKL